MKMLALDWDETITDKHMKAWIHGVPSNDRNPNVYIFGHDTKEQLPDGAAITPNSLQLLDSASLPIRDTISKQTEILEMMTLAMMKDIKIAIVTFSTKTDLIFHILKDLLIPEDLLKSIVIIYGGNVSGNKNAHINLAMKCHDIDEQEKGEILFVDDNQSNVLNARGEGYNSIIAKPDKAWIEDVSKILEQLPEIPHVIPTPISLKKVKQLNTEIFSLDDDSKSHAAAATTSTEFSIELPKFEINPSALKNFLQKKSLSKLETEENSTQPLSSTTTSSIPEETSAADPTLIGDM